MRYTRAFNIWNLSDEQRKRIPIGQWVYAGDPSNKGRFYGQGRTTVVAWLGNGRGRWRSYCEMIKNYGSREARLS